MAFITGLLGSGHCLGMCGGLVCALAMAGRHRNSPAFHLTYNLGRITTYTTIGLFAGWVGSAMAYTRNFAPMTRTALALSDLFIIAVGLATVFSWRRFNFSRLESRILSRAVSRGATALARLPGGISTLLLGLLMGFLPCGFLYAMVITAAQSGNPRSGATIMLAFGLGTGPAMFGFGWLAGMIGSRARGRMLTAAGVVVILMGGYNLYRHIKMIDWIMAAIPFASYCCR